MLPHSHPLSILLVDDDTMVIRILSRILSEFAPLRFATSGKAALKLARESLPDLVLLDVDMPEFSGFDVMKAFKSDAALAAVPIIFITSHDSPQLVAKGLELGATDFISKPPQAPLVLARVRACQRLKMLSDTLRSTVTVDFLTGAVTRREFDRTLILECQRTRRNGGALALLMAAIDGFADYNAAHGEDRGDACLQAVATALRAAAHRPTDVLGRYAGGQFALLLPETDARGAAIVAQRALDAAAAATAVSLSVGVGFSDALRSTDLPEHLTAAAEFALQSAGRSGGGRPVLVAMQDLQGVQHPRSGQ